MSYLRFVCLLASTLTAAAVLMAVTQSPTLQRGISVQMAASTHATSMPEADHENAWIVAVTADGKVYFGVDQSRPSSGRPDEDPPRKRDTKLYIKADARTPFTNVARVLEAARKVWFDAQSCLTSQPESSQSRNSRAPRGLLVSHRKPRRAGNSRCASVQIGSGGSPAVKINNEQVSWSSLQGKLGQISAEHKR